MTITALDLAKAAYTDKPLLFAAIMPETTWTETEGGPYGGTFTGPDDIRAGVFGRLVGEWDDFTAHPKDYFPSGEDVVVVLGRYTGVNKKTGKPLDAAFAHVFMVRDQKLVKFVQYTDTALFRDAMS